MPMQPSPSADTVNPCEPSCRESMRAPLRPLLPLRPRLCFRLELSTPGRRPPLDHDFLFCIEIDRVAALRVEIAEEAVLPSREGEVGHRRRDPDVDADVAR